MSSVNLYNLNMAPIVLRAFTALPAAGAYDTPVPTAIVGSVHATIFGEYTQGAPTGSVRLRIEVSPFSADQTAPALTWFPMTSFGQGVPAAGALTASIIEPEVVTFDPVTANREGFIFDVAVPASAERIRVSVAELGVVGTPGSCALTLLVSER